jgi:site-specific DNA-methyltransferase (adenine-specific)
MVVDFFAHSGSTLLAAERLNRRCYTMDNDPVYCEITIRRLERYRQTGRTGWQNGHPFEAELSQ